MCLGDSVNKLACAAVQAPIRSHLTHSAGQFFLFLMKFNEVRISEWKICQMKSKKGECLYISRVITLDEKQQRHTRHCKHLQRSQSHSIELIFVPWLERIFWINFDTKSTLLKIYSFENIFKKLLFVIIVFSFRKLLVSKNYKMLAFLTEVKKGSSTLP